MPKFNEDIVLTKDNVKEVLAGMHTTDTMFMNADCLLVEYHDIIKMPWYVLLSVIHQNERIQPLINVGKIAALTDYPLLEWYCQRSNRNPLIDLASAPLDKVDYDQILEILMSNNDVFYEVDTSLNAVNAIKTALKQKMVKEVIVYNETENSAIRKDLVNLFGKRSNVKFMHGDFSEVLKSIPANSSYMLSDFNKVVTMADCGHLSYSSLILPFDLAYNFVIDEEGKKKPVVDFDYLGGAHLFKVHYFNACYV